MKKILKALAAYILVIAAVFLVVAVLMQSGKSHNLSGTIAGASETFFGKSKATTIDRKLGTLTTVAAIIFVVLVLVAYLAQGAGTANKGGEGINLNPNGTTAASTAAPADSATGTAAPATSAPATSAPATSAVAE